MVIATDRLIAGDEEQAIGALLPDGLV